MTLRNAIAAVLALVCISCAETNQVITADNKNPVSAGEQGTISSTVAPPATSAQAQAAVSPPPAAQGRVNSPNPGDPPQANPSPEGNDPSRPRKIKNTKPADSSKIKADQNGSKNGNGDDIDDVFISQDQESMDQALELFTRSKVFWQKGDEENALKCLDEAYSFILDVNGDPDISRQKDDLRLMISRRILEIVAGRHGIMTTAGKSSEIPLIINEDVMKEIRSFQNAERNFFIRAYQRSAAYRPTIVKALKEAGLPEELSWLPLVESGFNITALSRARALGLWQFIPSTGYKYSLERDRWVDERMDLHKSTKAAISYLKELHAMFGDWLTCLAAYNCGEGRVMRVISKQHINYLDHFWDLYRQLPNETARYVPRFLATLHIIRDPAKYGMDLKGLPEVQPIAHEVVKTSKCMRIQDIATAINVSKDVLVSLNSELKHQMTPNREYDFKVPEGGAKIMSAELDKIPQWEAPKLSSREYARKSVHRVRKGESLNSIARKYKVSAQDIAAFNNLQGKVRVGQRLKIPGRAVDPGYAKKSGGKTKGGREAASAGYYKVKRGDTLASIAERYDTTPAELKKLNNMKSGKVTRNKVIKVPQKRVAQKEAEKNKEKD